MHHVFTQVIGLWREAWVIIYVYYITIYNHICKVAEITVSIPTEISQDVTIPLPRDPDLRLL